MRARSPGLLDAVGGPGDLRMRNRDFAPLGEAGIARAIPAPVRLHTSQGGQQGGCADVLGAGEGAAAPHIAIVGAKMGRTARNWHFVARWGTFNGKCDRSTPKLQIPPSTRHQNQID